MLEFASGYGCVSRHLGNVLPNMNVTSGDIHPEAITFIQNVLGKKAILSSATPEELCLEQKFDVVFALSFFSHTPDRTWGRWIRTLFSHLKDGGLLIFTTHGRESLKYFKNAVLDESGYWFTNESGQSDLATSDYGQTIVTPEYVVRKCFEHIAAPMSHFKSALWWEHQDLYIFARN